MANQSTLIDEVYDTSFETELDDSDKENQIYRSAIIEDCYYAAQEVSGTLAVDEDVGTVEEVVRADQSRRQFTHRERIQVHLLRDLGWTIREISDHTGYPLASIHKICTTPSTPKKRSGRSRALTTPIRKRLIDFVQESAANRRMTFLEVALHCGMLTINYNTFNTNI